MWILQRKTDIIIIDRSNLKIKKEKSQAPIPEILCDWPMEEATRDG